MSNNRKLPTYDLDELNEFFQVATVLPPDPVKKEEIKMAKIIPMEDITEENYKQFVNARVGSKFNAYSPMAIEEAKMDKSMYMAVLKFYKPLSKKFDKKKDPADRELFDNQREF